MPTFKLSAYLSPLKSLNQVRRRLSCPVENNLYFVRQGLVKSSRLNRRWDFLERSSDPSGMFVSGLFVSGLFVSGLFVSGSL
jgi:hypothetical protein